MVCFQETMPSSLLSWCWKSSSLPFRKDDNSLSTLLGMVLQEQVSVTILGENRLTSFQTVVAWIDPTCQSCKRSIYRVN